MMKIKGNKKRNALLLSILLVAFMLIPFVSVLAETVSGDNVIVESDETLEKTSFLSGSNVRVDGDINATTFITAANTEVNGTIDGDLFVTGQNATINGTVKGSVFVAGQNITVNGVVENTIYLAGATLKVGSQTNGSAFLAGQNVSIEKAAVIEKDAFVGASQAYQNGVINGDLSSSSESLSVGGKIGGDLDYSSQNKADFSGNSEVAGETTWKKMEIESYKDSRAIFTTAILMQVLFSIAASLVVWLFVRLIRPDLWTNLAEQITISQLKALGFGALAVVVVPIVSLLLMLTIIGIPLAFILLTLYGLSLYVSTIILAVFISLWFQKRFSWSNIQSFWVFLLGLIILNVLGIIPFIGWILGFITVSFGLGSIVLSILNRRTQIKSI
ncbi:hypothetical protein [Carnobacterium alterfunditum]|uniref:hypothetical protein n=1 Tax=Carnobacterium alterfunditum TaxID=28230 RepID=UPI00359367E3